MAQGTMNAIVVEQYGGIDNLVHKEVDKPPAPEGYDVLVSVKACSVNPIDVKVRAQIYDDFPTYYTHVPQPSPLPNPDTNTTSKLTSGTPSSSSSSNSSSETKGHQILGYDGAGTISALGPLAASTSSFATGDEIYYAGSPIRHGSNAEYQLVDSRSIAKKPNNLSFVEAAALPLTWITAYEALVERMEIQKGERAGVLIVNGAGGVGSVASQIARHVLQLPVVITTASRPETKEFSTSMGATHTINHREDLVPQIEALKLDVPIKYVFITHSTTPYIAPAAAICAPFGKVCTIVQSKDVPMYGTEFMAKSLSFVYCLIGTKSWYGVEVESHGRILRELAELIEKGVVRCHLKQKFRLDVGGLREAHEAVEAGGSIGKNGLSVDFGEGGACFT